MKTYSRADWLEAQDAWKAGKFDRTLWRDIRHTMAMQGCIFPPNGDRFDSWDDDQPSQRAVLVRALRETPILLRECTVGARTWDQIIDRLFRARDEWRRDLYEVEPPEDGPTHHEAVMALGAIIRRMEESV